MGNTKTHSSETSKYVVAMYIRLSVEDAKTDSLSIPNQRLLLGRHIDTMEQNDIEVLEFIDNGYSGTNFERPAVQKLLELVRQSHIDCVIVKDFSRFGRNSIEMGYFIEMVFPLFHTRFISVGDSFDTNNYKEDTGGMEVAFKYLMHEYYSKDLSNKTKSSKYSKMKRGEYQSEICCYGYKKGANGRLEIDPIAAAIVRLVFDLALKTRSAQDIIRILHEKGIPTPGEYKASKGKRFHDVSRCGGIWPRSTVLRMLSDERYIGTYVMGKRSVKEVGGRSSRLKAESEWFKIPNHHSPIVDKAVYEQVQSKLTRFKCAKHERDYILRSKVICGCCRHALNRVARKEPVFVCRHTKIDIGAECHGLEVGEQELENLLFEIISKQALVILNIDNVGGLEMLEMRVAEQTEYDNRIGQLNDSKCDLYERYVLKEIDGEQFKFLKADIDAQLNRLTRARAIVASQVGKMKMSGDAQGRIRAVAEKVSGEAKLTKAIADMLIDKVFIFPDNQIEIFWKVAGFAAD